jgi:hypothetical protein
MSSRQSLSGWLLLAGGGAILGSAAVHGAINVPHLLEDMVEMGTRPGLLRAVSLVLYFSVVAMFAFAALVLNAGVSMMRGQRPPVMPLWLISASYVAFGMIAFVFVFPNAHFLGYSGMGLLVGVAAAVASPRPARAV